MSGVKILHMPAAEPRFNREIENAARLHAQAQSADPFAYIRSKHYMKMGYDLPSDVIHDAIQKLEARGHKVKVEIV